MSSSTAAAGTTISEGRPTKVTDRGAVRHDASRADDRRSTDRRTADLGRPRGRRGWADFAERENPSPSAP